MKTYPLTFAVFFQSILAPNMSVTKNHAKDILFAEQYPPPEHSIPVLSPGTYSDYIRGKRPVRAESVRFLCGMPPENLVRRIQLLGLQDMPAALSSVKKLLEICEISADLRQKLQTEAEETKDPALYLAKIFQLSLKCDNKKILLEKEDVLLLNTIEKYHVSNAKERDFQGFQISFQEVKLPEDFERLWAYVLSFVSVDSSITYDFAIMLDMEQVIKICALDMERRICTKGNLTLVEVSCAHRSFANLQKTLDLFRLDLCTGLLLGIFGDASLSEASDILQIFENTFTESPDIGLSIAYKNQLPNNRIIIRAIFRTEPPAPS